MPVGNYPTQFANYHRTTLRSSMTSTTQTTGIVLDPLTSPLDPTVTKNWEITGPQLLRFFRDEGEGTRQELIYAPSATVNADKTITLGTCFRNMKTDGSLDQESTTGIKWTAGTIVELCVDAVHMEDVARLSADNALGGHQTLATTKELRFTDSSVSVKRTGNDLVFDDGNNSPKTLSDLAALSGSDEKTKISSADTTTNFLENKLAAGTGITVTKNNPGANESLSVSITSPVAPTLGGTGQTTVAKGDLFAGNGTNTVGKLTVGTNDHVLTADSAQPTGLKYAPIARFFKQELVSTTNATAGDTTTNENLLGTYTLTVPASSLVNGVRLPIEYFGTRATAAGAGNTTFRLKLGTTTIVSCAITTTTHTDGIYVRGHVVGTGPANVSATVEGALFISDGNNANNRCATAVGSATVNTTIDQTLQISIQSQNSGNTNAITVSNGTIDKTSSTAF